VLLCINGTGSANRWVRQIINPSFSYREMNQQADSVPIGSDGIRIIPFGNGAERMLHNQIIGAHVLNIDLNKHSAAHIYRATQEGVACAMRYGLDIMRSNGIHPTVIKAGNANMFLSRVFARSFVNFTQVPLELWETEGSVGAALGAGIGMGFYKEPEEAFIKREAAVVIDPTDKESSEELYQSWKRDLERFI
jgi:xylulokinase